LKAGDPSLAFVMAPPKNKRVLTFIEVHAQRRAVEQAHVQHAALVDAKRSYARRRSYARSYARNFARTFERRQRQRGGARRQQRRRGDAPGGAAPYFVSSAVIDEGEKEKQTEAATENMSLEQLREVQQQQMLQQMQKMQTTMQEQQQQQQQQQQGPPRPVQQEQPPRMEVPTDFEPVTPRFIAGDPSASSFLEENSRHVHGNGGGGGGGGRNGGFVHGLPQYADHRGYAHFHGAYRRVPSHWPRPGSVARGTHQDGACICHGLVESCFC
jgi:hypothetical protein